MYMLVYEDTYFQTFLEHSLELFVEVGLQPLDTLSEHRGLDTRAVVCDTHLRRLQC